MPAIAAHYKFGQLVLEKLPVDLKKLILTNKNLFDLGTQGPDLLFYYNPLKKNPVSSHGVAIHSRAADAFFGDALLRGCEKNNTALAYLLGQCCHFALDYKVHPYVKEVSNDETKSHMILESDLESLVIKSYDMDDKRFVYLPKKVSLSAIATVFNISVAEAKTSHKNMLMYTKILDRPALLKPIEKIMGKPGAYTSLSLKNKLYYKNESKILLEMYQQAVTPAVELVTELYEAIKNGKDLPQTLRHNFEGELMYE